MAELIEELLLGILALRAMIFTSFLALRVQRPADVTDRGRRPD